MLDTELVILGALLVAALIAVAALWMLRRQRHPAPGRSATPPPPSADVAVARAAASTPAMAGPIPWSDALFERMTRAVHAHGFGAANFQYYAVNAEHAEVIERVRKGIPDAAGRREYFPRKPQVVPRLLAAIRNSDSSLKELTEIIMRDPVLAGDVLRMANSAYYRGAKGAIDSIDRAVVVLGFDGLRVLVANSVMQPVFQVPRGYFETFSPMVWRQAHHAAVAAQTYATTTRECDGFAAHLLALVFYVSHIVLFRMAVESYVAAAGSLPRADVFARILDELAEPLAREIATDWGLSAPMLDALDEHVARGNVDALSPLARSLYVGRACGSGIVAVGAGEVEEGDVLALLQRKGLPAERAERIWRETRTVDGAANS
jgi:HD-like signal output (HDOD) protein